MIFNPMLALSAANWTCQLEDFFCLIKTIAAAATAHIQNSTKRWIGSKCLPPVEIYLSKGSNRLELTSNNNKKTNPSIFPVHMVLAKYMSTRIS